jgi:hypothetical protein
MPTNFPTSVDNFTNPTANDSLNLPSHSTQHANANDAIEAIEGYLLTGTGKNGLTHINTTSFTTASAVQLDNVFTSTYKNYRIIWKATPSQTQGQQIRFCTGGTPQTAANYSQQNTDFTTATTYLRGSGAQQIDIGAAGGVGAPYAVVSCVDIVEPQVSDKTYMVGSSWRFFANTLVMGSYEATASFDGIRIFATAGTFTGTVSVYGYRDS